MHAHAPLVRLCHPWESSFVGSSIGAKDVRVVVNGAVVWTGVVR